MLAGLLFLPGLGGAGGFVLQGGNGGTGPIPFFDVIIEITQIFCDTVFFHHHDLFGKTVDEVTVVADSQNGAGEIPQSVFQHFAAVHIQMVGGLVQKQKVVLLEHQLGKRYPAPFAAGELFDLLENLVAGEEEQAQRTADAGLLQLGESVPYLVQNGMLMLVIIADVDIGAETDAAMIGVDLVGQDAKKGTLAYAVGADERHPVAGAQLEG